MRSTKSGDGMPLAMLGVFALLIGVGVVAGLVSVTIALVYAAASVVTFLMYFQDKSAARRGRWRTKESSLHLMALLCGWPGALLAQTLLRHKSSKPAFLATYWITVLCNCAALLYVLFFEDASLRM